MYFTQVVKKCNDYSGRAVEKKRQRKSVLRASNIFAVLSSSILYTANVIPVKITDNPRTDPCTMCVKCKYYRDYLYHDMPVIVI